MNQPLTCDEVFDHLTRAPFPAGEATDHSVDDHLRACHDCRQVAEALRPATDLFREVMSDDQRRRLPAYRGQLLATMTRDSKLASAIESTSPTQFRVWNPVAIGRASGRGHSWYFLPALGLAMLLMAAILQGRGMLGHSSGQLPVAGGLAAPDHTLTCVMAGLALPQDCLPRSIVGPTRATPIQTSTQPSGAGHHQSACLNCHESVTPAAVADVCCTNCHAAALRQETGDLQTRPRPTLLPRLATSCTRCHDTKQRG